MKPVELRISRADHDRLQAHLHRPDRDEHGALAIAGVHRGAHRDRLLVRELRLLEDAEFPPGEHGYRQFAPLPVAEVAGRAGDVGAAYVAFHSHPASDRSTGLSRDDLDAHQRLFPHLLDLTRGLPVAGVATGRRSAAGEAWFADEPPRPIDDVIIVGSHLEHLGGRPDALAAPRRFDRQARLFGDEGQRVLRGMRVAVIGAGGGGSMIAEQLAHLGVGALEIIDYDRVEEHNLSRIVGARGRDARRRVKKVEVARRHVRSINPDVEVVAVDGDIADAAVADRLLGCDFLFLATDTATSRLVFNAVVHRYLIPGIQIGAKVELGAQQEILDVYVAVRPVLPDTGCLYCQGLISPIRLQEESRTAEEARAQDYLETPEVIDPSVITLNGIAASHAVNTMLFSATGLLAGQAQHQMFFLLDGDVRTVEVAEDPDCPFCGRCDGSGFGLGGDVAALPVRRAAPGQAPRGIRAALDRVRLAVLPKRG